jgi:hypothetical protein
MLLDAKESKSADLACKRKALQEREGALRIEINMRKQLLSGNSGRKIPPALQTSASSEPLKATASAARTNLRTVQPWDLLIGGREHDVLAPGKFEEVKKQTCEAAVTWLAPDCKTMSSARDKPIRGRKKQREVAGRNLMVLLLWWCSLGPTLAWHKGVFDTEVRWTGAEISVKDAGAFSINVPDKYITEVGEEVVAMLEVNMVEKKRLQRLAGKTGWASGLVPILGSMISPFWAALRDGPETSGESYVPVKRFRHALLWLLPCLKHRSHALKRTYYINRHRWPARICITCDASPWGGGAWLAVDGTPKEWMAIKWTSEDEGNLGLQIALRKDKEPGRPSSS